MTLTPGAYIKHRRTAAGFGIADVAAAVATEPRVAEHLRAEWLALIEADAMPASFATIVALRGIFHFDLAVLEQLELIQMGVSDVPAPRLCRICACSQEDPCIVHGQPCGWQAADLCTAHGISEVIAQPELAA